MTALLLPPEEIAKLRVMKGLAYMLAVMITLDRRYPGNAFRPDQIALVAGMDERTAIKQLRDLSSLDRVILTSSGYVLTQGGRALFLAPANDKDLALSPAQQALEAQAQYEQTDTHSVCALVVVDSLTPDSEIKTTTTPVFAKKMCASTDRILAATPVLFGEPGIVKGKLALDRIEPEYALAVVAHCYALRRRRDNPKGLNSPAAMAYTMLLNGRKPRAEFIADPVQGLPESYLSLIGLQSSEEHPAQDEPDLEVVTATADRAQSLITPGSAAREWQSAMEFIRADMPRGLFERYVKPTRAVSFDGGVFTVGAPTQEACDWLESRMEKIVEHILVGILTQRVAVRFVVDESLLIEEEDDGEEEPD